MIQNNNMSILPWYKSINDQDARKWWIYGKIYPLYAPATRLLPFQILSKNSMSGGIVRFTIYTSKGVFVKHITSKIRDKASVKQVEDYYALVYPANVDVDFGLEPGQYYATMSTGAELWFSEVFTIVNDISPYLKLEWWDKEDLVTDAGTIVYTSPNYRNTLYLCADIAKPEYKFEEDGETRDGYFFPVKQISEKVYHFNFLASEYLLDVIRLVRLADFAWITKDGKIYKLDTFLITPEWEDNGDIATVEAEFETATVVKKIGMGYSKAQYHGDFNNSYNHDFYRN